MHSAYGCDTEGRLIAKFVNARFGVLRKPAAVARDVACNNRTLMRSVVQRVDETRGAKEIDPRHRSLRKLRCCYLIAATHGCCHHPAHRSIFLIDLGRHRGIPEQTRVCRRGIDSVQKGDPLVDGDLDTTDFVFVRNRADEFGRIFRCRKGRIEIDDRQRLIARIAHGHEIKFDMRW